MDLEELRKIEEKWQKAWEEAKVFEAEPKEGKKKYFITVPYPYTSGSLHIGHGRTYTTGDIIARYKRMRGYNVLFPMAFHITGTPILAISDRIRKGDEDFIRLYKSYVALYEEDEKKVDEIIESFKDPWNVANYFAKHIIEDFKSLGYSIDWRRKFNTGEPIYNAFVTWQYKKLKKLGLIVQGKHAVLYCPAMQSAVGEDDIKDGDVNPVEIIEYVIIKFRFRDGYLVAATLRPETIFGATNVWVNPEGRYAKVQVGDETWYVSWEAYEKLRYQKDDVVLLQEFRGQDFLGAKVTAPTGKTLVVLPATFVDVDNGTGVVFSVPAHAPYDWIALKDLKDKPELLKKYGLHPEILKGIEPISIIEIEGYGPFPAQEVCEELEVKSQEDFEKLEKATRIIYKQEFYHGVMRDNCAQFSGMKVSEVKEHVVRWLEELGLCDVFYETSRKAVSRANDKVIVAVLKDQWFIDYSKEWWKNLAREAVDSLMVVPEKYKQVLYDTIDWLHQRPCARMRGLGTKLPFDQRWIIESLSDSTIYMAFYTIAHIIRECLRPEQLKEELFDYVFLGSGDVKELARKIGVSEALLRRMRSEFTYWYPNDHRHTAPAHLSNHLTFFVMHHCAIFPEQYWPKLISLNELVIREGAKMSKSKGNVIPLVEISRKYSADLYRLYVATSADLDSVMDWRERDVQALKGKLFTFINLVRQALKAQKLKKKGHMERWLISRFYSKLKSATEDMDKLKIRSYAVKLFFEVMNDISYYERRTGSREKKFSVIREFVEDWLKSLAPVIPHICEELWHQRHDTFISLESWPKAREDLIDQECEEKERLVQTLYQDLLNLVQALKVKPKVVHIFVASEWKRKVHSHVLKHRNMSAAIKACMQDPELRARAKEVQALVRREIEKLNEITWLEMTQEEEEELLRDASKFLEAQLGCQVKVWKEEEAKEEMREKARQAYAGKPGIFIQA